MSEVRVNKLSPRSGTTVTLGDSGDTISIPSGVTLSNAGTNTFASATITGDLTVDTNTLKVDSTNNRVGIGTTTPTATLNIQSSTDASIDIDATSGSTQDAFIKFGSTDNGTVYLGVDDSEQLFKINNATNLSSDNHFVINGSGNVGIGTSTPAEKLDIYRIGSGITTRFGKDSIFGELRVGGDSVGFTGTRTAGTADNAISGYYINNDINSGTSRFEYLTLKTINTERMRIDSSGNVGIGNTTMSSFNSEANNLVVGTGAADEGITIYSGSSVGDHGSIFFADGTDVNAQRRGQIRYEQNNEVMSFFTNTSERMRIDVSGNVGINTTSPEAGSVQTISHPGSSKYGLNLDSSNTSGTQYHLQFKRGGTQAGYITSNTATTISVNNASDERLKENIQNSGSAIQDIKDMQVRQFDWKDNIDTHRDFGFVAQELVNVVPEAVTQGTDELDDNGKPVRSWGIDYSHIVPRLVKVCQEQQTKIEELEARITQLENA